MLNMDFTQRVVCQTNEIDWVESPSKMVLRKALEREAAESGHVTSVVKYLPSSSFPKHIHPMGEEIYVLEGIFSDEHGDYPAGTYLRNPPNSYHSPFSREACTIFVKLNQFDVNDLTSVRINTLAQEWHSGQGGLQVMPLHEFEGKNTALVKWPAGEKFTRHRHFGGEEIYVLKGTFKDEHGVYPRGTWLRNPHLSEHFPYVDEETIILDKTGHLLS